MSGFKLNVQELNDKSEPRVVLALLRDEEIVLQRQVRVFEEDDLNDVSNQITETGEFNSADVDQMLAEVIEPIRIKWLRASKEKETNQATVGVEGVVIYAAVLPGADDSGEASIRDIQKNRVLSNFVVLLDEDIEVQDDIESRREFAGRLIGVGRTVPFRITAKDYADNGKLKAALFEAGGPELVIHCQMDELRKAISTVSRNAGVIQPRKLTTNFGWTADRRAFLSPSYRITAAGVEAINEQSELRVDLSSETPACHLDLKKLDEVELVRVKRHIVDDLLHVNDPLLTNSLLGAVSAAVLYPFINGVNRFALWIVGLTGCGKSFPAKLFSNFFGDFPVSSAPFATWSATPNFIQRQGYFFKDSLYVVDDYKPEVVQAYQVVRVLQTYADNTARGRLKADATANVMRPIRGLLICTGEDVPDHNASVIGRSLIISVPKDRKNIEAGNRCKRECQNYAGVTADFVHWLMQKDRIKGFEQRFEELQERYHRAVIGQQNDLRIAQNLALLGASFEQFAMYLSDVWPGWKEAVQQFLEVNLVEIRTTMLGEAREQQASEVFLRTLSELIQYGHVRIDGYYRGSNADNKPVVGRLINSSASRPGMVEICTSLALGEVNRQLRQQGRPELKITVPALLQQLFEDGKLVDRQGVQLVKDADKTWRTRLSDSGNNQSRVIAIRRQDLLVERGF